MRARATGARSRWWGADPAGLSLALILAQQGVSVTVLDLRRSFAAASRSATWSSHTLELWARLGLADAALLTGLRRRQQQVLLVGPGDKEPVLAAEVCVDERPNCWIAPRAVHLQQYRVEQLLHGALAALPARLVDVRWRCTVEGFTAGEEGVALQYSVPGAGGKTVNHELKSAYVVVCSATAKLHSVLGDSPPPLPGCSDRSTRTVLSVDLELRDAAVGASRRLLLASRPEGIVEKAADTASWLAVSQRAHPDGLVRLDAILPAGVDLHKASRAKGAEELARAVLGPAAVGAVRTSVAQQFRVGAMHRASLSHRVYLCGEALEVASPFGGAAGNLAVEDAANLAWKLALVLMQGAPPTLLETYQAEREAARNLEAQRQHRADQLLAPATSAQREVQLSAVSLLRSGHELGAALLLGAGALPHCAPLPGSPLLVADAASADAASSARFRLDAPGPGDVFADCAVEDLEHGMDADSKPPAATRRAAGFLLRHTGAFFTVVVFAMTVEQIPWEALKLIDRSRLQLTLELLRKVVIIIDASTLERTSDAHTEAVGRARRIGVHLLADQGGSATESLDGRPGTVFLIRPDLHIVARWRELRPRDIHGAFLRATGHFLHESVPPARSPSPAPSPAPGQVQSTSVSRQSASPPGVLPQDAACRLLVDLSERLAAVPTDGRLSLAMAAVMLLAEHVGSQEAVQGALALATSAALTTQLDGEATAAAAAVEPAGGAEPAAAPRTLPLRLTGQLAASLEAGRLGVAGLAGAIADGLAGSGAQLGDVPEGEDAAPGVTTGLVSSEVAVDLLTRVLHEDPDAYLTRAPPPAGLLKLQERLAAELGQAEGLHIPPEGVVVSEGPGFLLRHLLENLQVGSAADGPSSGGSQLSGGSAALVGTAGCRAAEVLLVGLCPSSWLPALRRCHVRRFDPPSGPGHSFKVFAEDVARNVAAETRVVLMPLFSTVTGVPADAAELSALGRFIDHESGRRRATSPESGCPLVLVVDVTMRALQLDVGAEAAGEALHVLAGCQQSLVFGELFGQWSPAPGLKGQYAATLADEPCKVLAAAAAAAQACSGAPAGSLVQALAAVLPREVRSLEGLRRRREVLCDALRAAGISILGGRPRAGHYICAQLPEDIDEADYCEALKAHGVEAEAGTLLGVPGCVRLSFAVHFDVLEDSLQAFATAMHDVRQWQRQGDAKGPRYVAAQARAREQLQMAVANGDVHSMRASLAEAEAARVSAEELAMASDTLAEMQEASDSVAAAAEQQEGGTDESEWSRTPDLGTSSAFDQSAAGGPRVQDGEGGIEAAGGAADRLTPCDEDPDASADAAAVADAEKAGKAAPLSAQLRRGARALACVVQMSGSITTELISQAGFELIIVDHENGPGDFGVVANLVRSALGSGSHALLRLPEAEVSLVSRALNAGAEGVLLPRVASQAEAQDFVELVREARERLRGDDATEWREGDEEEEDGHASEAQQPALVDPAVPQAAPPPPRPLVAVEIEPACGLELAEAVLEVEGIDLVFLDPERAAEHLVGKHGGGQYSPTSPAEANHAGDQAAGGVPRVADAEAAAGEVASPSAQGADDAPGAEESPTDGAYPASPEKGMLPSVPQDPPPAFRRGVVAALKAPALGQRKHRPQHAALPSKAAEELGKFWTRFDALPARAAENRKLLGCCAHSRTSPQDLLMAGHSVVAIAADMVLLREGAVRHASEMKADKATKQRSFATPLESARARLASSALVAQLRRRKVALGAFVHLGDPLGTELISLAGFEAVILDHEQGVGDLLNAVGLVHAATSAGAHSMLRVPGSDAAYLRRALQLGVDGIILPHTQDAQQAADFVALARRCWPSSSQRSGGGPVASVLRPNAGAPSAQHLRRRGEELLLKACQIDTEAGLAAVRDIARVEGVDMIFFAPVELAASVCRGAEAGTLSALEDAEAEVKNARKLLGGMLVPGRSAEQMFASGYDLVCTTSDVILIRSAAENVIRETKPPATGPTAGLIKWVVSGRQSRLARDEETLVARLKKGREARALGAMVRFGSPAAAELVARYGFEVVVMDHSRGPNDLLGAVGIVHAAARAGAHAMIRVPAISHAHLRRALQIGVEGVILPHVESAEDAHALVELCLYPARNYREDAHAAEARLRNQPFRRMDFSFAPPLVEFYGQRVAEFTRRQGEAVLIAAQIDTATGAQNVREIAKVPGIDMIFVDATRLSGSDVERAEHAAKSESKLLGGMLVPGCTAEEMFRAGYRLVCAASDEGLLAAGARACVRAKRGAGHA